MRNPIDREDFNPHRARPANEVAIKNIQYYAKRWKSQQEEADHYKRIMTAAIREAKENGHSFPQLASAAGVSIGTIQRMVAGGGGD